MVGASDSKFIAQAVSLFTFAAAYALQSNGLRYASTDKDMHRHLITSSLAKYREALTRLSTSALSMRNYAQMIAWEGDRKRAGELFHRAHQLSPHDPSTLLAVRHALMLRHFLLMRLFVQLAKFYALEGKEDEAAMYRALLSASG